MFNHGRFLFLFLLRSGVGLEKRSVLLVYSILLIVFLDYFHIISIIINYLFIKQFPLEIIPAIVVKWVKKNTLWFLSGIYYIKVWNHYIIVSLITNEWNTLWHEYILSQGIFSLLFLIVKLYMLIFCDWGNVLIRN